MIPVEKVIQELNLLYHTKLPESCTSIIEESVNRKVKEDMTRLTNERSENIIMCINEDTQRATEEARTKNI